MRVKEESEKVCLKFNIQKTKIMASSPICSVQFSRSVVSDSLPPHGLQHTGLPFYHQLLELAQTHVHRVGDAIQPSPPLLCPSPPAIRVVSSVYLRLLIFLLAILIPACDSSSPASCMMYSAQKLNRVAIYSLDILLSQF